MSDSVYNNNNNLSQSKSLSISAIAEEIPCGNFNLLSLNICSLNGHYEELQEFLAAEQDNLFDVICLQEVWSINSDYSLPGYHPLVFKSRDQNSNVNRNCGGGIAVYISNTLEFDILDELSVFRSGIYESIWLKINSKGDKSIIIGNIYRP